MNVITKSSLFILVVLAAVVTTYAAETHKVGDGVFFYESDGGSNIGWVVFKDYVLVIDANFPDTAELALAEIKKTTDKPVRFIFDTHHHGDHAYGNNIFVRDGAAVVSQVNCFNVLSGAQESYKRWAQGKPAYLEMGLKVPSIIFNDELVYDDGSQRVELKYFGHGHTVGDAVAYLPKQKILFTGDLCVNGAFNYMGESNSESWVNVLTRVKELDTETVCPGHGKMAGKDLLDTQLKYFVELRKQVIAAFEQEKTVDETITAINIPFYKEWTGVTPPEAHVRFVYSELEK